MSIESVLHFLSIVANGLLQVSKKLRYENNCKYRSLLFDIYMNIVIRSEQLRYVKCPRHK